MQEAKETLRGSVFWDIIEPLPMLRSIPAFTAQPDDATSSSPLPPPTPPTLSMFRTTVTSPLVPKFPGFSSSSSSTPTMPTPKRPRSPPLFQSEKTNNKALLAEPVTKKQKTHDDVNNAPLSSSSQPAKEEAAMDATDALMSFIQEQCEMDPLKTTCLSDLRLAFNAWAGAEGTMSTQSMMTWIRSCKGNGLDVKIAHITGSGFRIKGMGLKTLPSQEPKDQICRYRAGRKHPICGNQAVYRSIGPYIVFYCEQHRCKKCAPRRQAMCVLGGKRCGNCNRNRFMQ